MHEEHYLWSPELAYVVGLLATDGNLSPDGRHISFVSKEYEQVARLRSLLGAGNRVTQTSISGYTGRANWRIQLGSVIFYRWLLDIGLHPNKSKTLGPLAVPDEYFFDFLRGCLDGDGTVKVYNDPAYPRSRRLYVTFVTASQSFAEWQRAAVARLSGITGYIDRGPRVWRLNFAKRASIALLARMYYRPDVPCLARKRVLAEEFLTAPAALLGLEADAL